MKPFKNFKEFIKILIVAGLSLLIIVPVLNKSNISKTIHDLKHPLPIFSNDKKQSAGEDLNNFILKEKPSWTGKYKLEMKELDHLGRAVQSHILLQKKNMPKKVREPRLNYNPVGWHNYKFNGKWLMNRGHLVGYQFSGLNDEARNLVPETAYLNAGALSGMDDSNASSMLFYENRLAAWLRMNPDKWLDYTVTPIYKDNELLPRQIQLNYVGFDKNGKILPLRIGGNETSAENNTTQVILDNTSPNAIINYATGTAKQK